MVREESPNHGLQTRTIDGTVRRTQPHLLNRQNRKRPNMRASTPICRIIGGSRMNPTNASSGNYNQFGLPPTTTGDSSSLLQSQTVYTGVVPQDGVTKAYLYLPELLCTTSKNAATSGSPYREGTPREASHNPSEHIRLLLEGRESGGSNPRTLDYQLPHQLSSFYHVVPQTNGNNDWNHPQHQQVAQNHCSQPGRNKQLTLPSYWSSQHTSNSNILHTPRTRATSSSVVGKCPTVSNLAQSFFQPPPSSSSVLGKRPTTSNPVRSFFQPPPPLSSSNADDMVPQCRLETDELLRLFQSMGTPEFLAISDRVLRSGSSQHDPLRAASAHIPVRGTSAASAPNLLLGLGNGGGIDKGKGKEGTSYWDLDAMVEMMESMNKRQRKVTGQQVPDLTLGSDGQGGSKDKRN